MFKLRLSALALALLAFASPALARQAPVAAPSPEASALRPDPAVRTGALPNGMRWVVMRNAAPPGVVSLRMRVRVGSFEEREHELGVAHFVEHMAFNGTRNFPEGRLEPAFSAYGVAFGRDQNASTSATETRYSLDIPQATEPAVLLGFRWLRDVADGLSFTEEAVNRERGVVLAEHNRTLGAAESFGRAYLAFLGPDLRGPTRLPIGSPEVIRTVTPETLRGFYQAWYRPENVEVSVVGDIAPERMEALIRAAFESWRAPDAPAGARAERGRADLTRGLDVLVRREPQLPTTVRACFAREPERLGADSVQRRRRQLVRLLWTTALHRRLQAASQPADAPFVSASAGLEGGDREIGFFCFSALPRNDDWRGALNAVALEVRRLQAHGVTEAEMRRDLEAMRVAYQVQANRISLRQTQVLADSLIDTLPDPDEDTDVPTDQVENLRVFNLIAPTIQVADVNAAAREDTTGAGPLIAVTSPEPVEAQAVRVAWSAASAAAAPGVYADRSVGTWAYARFGEPGRVSRREVLPPGFTRVTFENGVVLNFKNVPDNPETVEVRVLFGHGQRGVSNADYQAAQLGVGLFAGGGLRRHGYDELRDLFSSRLVSARLGMSSRAFVLAGSTRPSDLDVELQVLAAYVSDPGFRNDRSAAIPTAVDLMFRVIPSSPTASLSLALQEAVAPNSPRSLPPRATLSALTQSDFRRILEPSLREAPLEVTIVGDLDEATAVRLTAATFGALPARRGGPPERQDTFFIRYPEAGLPPVRTTHAGDPHRAAVAVVWPLWVAEPSRRREEWSVQLLSRILEDAVRREVREELGLTYSPSAGAEMPDHDDQGTLTVVVETSAADVDRVRAAVLEVARDLAGGDISQTTVDESRAAWLNAIVNRQRTVAFWTDALTGTSVNDQNLRDQLEFEPILRSLTVEDIRRAASTWLSRPPVIAVSEPQGVASGDDRQAARNGPAVASGVPAAGAPFL